MSEAYLAGTLKHLPAAEIRFDRYAIRSDHVHPFRLEPRSKGIPVISRWHQDHSFAVR